MNLPTSHAPPEPRDRAEDDRLMARFAQGDQSAARALTARHLGRVFNQARRMLRDDAEAEDVAQEAMMRLWKQAPAWEAGGARLTTWLYRVTANLCIDRLRRQRPDALDAVAEPADDRPGVEAQMQTRSRADALHAALAALPDRQRLAMSLRFLDDLPNPEVASIMEISVEAVESLLARGKRSLAERLREMGDAL